MNDQAAKSDIAVIGLAVMGQNLILNFADKGFQVTAHNRTTSKIHAFLDGPAKHTSVVGAETLQDMVASLKKPRKVMTMIRAGDPVDSTIDALLPLLEPGDIIIDGGNANFNDSTRRTRYLQEQGILFVGAGISGGEEGARHGPSIMPGGNPAAWPQVKPLLQAIAARTDTGDICCDWVGEEGAGHYVKMVHNGIEYGDMQLIAEAYHLLKAVHGQSNQQMQQIFRHWNTTELESYLIDISGDILGHEENGHYVLDVILDKAGQKGTGKWTAINALEAGIPLTLIAESVFARALSALKDERVIAARTLVGPGVPEQAVPLDDATRAELQQALLCAKILSYTQGFMLMRSATEELGWHLDFPVIASLWRAGCIIRSVFLDDIRRAFENDPTLPNLLLDNYFGNHLNNSHSALRSTIKQAVTAGIPVPAMSAALSFYDGYRSAWVPANMIQAQRDYFGAHTYERQDKPRGERFHTDWNASGGDVASSTYDA